MSADLERRAIPQGDGEPLTPDEIFRPGTFAYERNKLDTAHKSGELTGIPYFEASSEWAERRNAALELQEEANDRDAKVYYRAAISIIVGRVVAAGIVGGKVNEAFKLDSGTPLLTAGIATGYVAAVTIVGKKVARKIKVIESRKPE